MNTIAAAAVLALAALAGALLPGRASAQASSSKDVGANVAGGPRPGDVMVRLRAIGVLPQDSSSSISATGGRVRMSDTAGPEVDLSYFFTDRIAMELIAASTRHKVTAAGTALGRVDVGTTCILPPTLTVQ